MAVKEIIRDIGVTGLTIPISTVANGNKIVFIAITADGTLDSANTRCNMEEGNNLSGADDEWNELGTLPGPFLVISGTVLLKFDNFSGAFIRCKLAGGATAGVLTFRTFYKK